jgi:hypothetical protein
MNMKKEYRREMRQLNKVVWKLNRNYRNFERLMQREIKDRERAIARAARNTTREGAKIALRLAILEGRLQ